MTLTTITHVSVDGRRTYEIFAGSWGTGPVGADQGDNPDLGGVEHAAQVRGIDHAALELVDSRATPSGVIIQVYLPTGRPQYAT